MNIWKQVRPPPPQGLGVGFVMSAPHRGKKMGCGVRPPQGLGIKAMVESYVVLSLVGECYGTSFFK